MNSYTEYVRTLEAVYQAHPKILRSYPASLLEYWESFVRQCEGGYSFDITEYYNDILVRDQLAFLLSVPELQGFPEFQELAARVHAVDDRFRALLQPGVFFPPSSEEWWKRGVLRYAGREYVSDMISLFGIPVVEVDDEEIPA